MERDYGPLTIEQAAANVASHLRFLMLMVAQVPVSSYPYSEACDEALRSTIVAEEDLARSLADYGEAIARVGGGTWGAEM